MTSQGIISTDTVSTPALLLEEDQEHTVTHLVVHPLVLLHVLDHHTRRNEATGRVIGTLLGRRDGNKVEVTNCFAVPHAERGDEVAIGKDFNKQMMALYSRANRKEQVVGWYASATSGEEEDNNNTNNSKNNNSNLIMDTSSLIHEFYAGECDETDPIHLVVDTRLETDSISIRAFRSTPVVVQGEPLANLFHELRLTLNSTEPETICLNQMVLQEQLTLTSDEDAVAAATAVQKDDSLALQVSMEKLHSVLDGVLQYVDSVVEGKVAPDPELGRQIADSLASVPRVRPEIFEQLFHDSLQDLLMVTYLSNITRTQLAIAEKLNASLSV